MPQAAASGDVQPNKSGGLLGLVQVHTDGTYPNWLLRPGGYVYIDPHHTGVGGSLVGIQHHHHQSQRNLGA